MFTLTDLKGALGIDPADVSRDWYLTKMIGSALKAAEKYCNELDFLTLVDVETGELVLPDAVELGMIEWIRAGLNTVDRGGVLSESIGGMSQSFESGSAGLAAAQIHWQPYHSDITFMQIGRRYR